jgi:nickel-dependent lactate racemase
MRVVVDFQDECLELELPEEQLVAAWRGPTVNERFDQAQAIRSELENPREFPPLRQMVVPGDRVVIAFDPSIADSAQVLESLMFTLEEAGIAAGSVTVLSSSPGSGGLERTLPRGARPVVHDPGDRAGLAYLATTQQGRRIYLNRHLTDADVVIPVGRLGYDPILGYRGPWSVLFPDLSDQATMQVNRSRLRDDSEDASEARTRASLDESFEVSWLLGSQFHVGILPGSRGLIEALAGRENAVRAQGIAALDQHWTLHADARAELVTVGIGRPGVETTMESLAQGLATATRLVQHGGKIIVLSRAAVEIGPSLRCLIDADDPKRGASALRGHEGDEDSLLARRLAQAVSWADVFLLSGLDRELAEDLSLIALEHPDQARRLVARSGSCTFVSHADLTRAVVRDNGEP